MGEEKEEEEEKFGLDTSFAGASGQKKEDPHLEAYINARMAPKEEAVEEAPREKTREERLYEVPAELQVADNQSGDVNKMSWQVGLSEVPLPIEYKLANIEATELAKRTYLHGDGTTKAALLEPDAVTRKAFGNRFQYSNLTGANESSRSTDNATVERFRKRMRQDGA